MSVNEWTRISRMGKNGHELGSRIMIFICFEADLWKFEIIGGIGII